MQTSMYLRSEAVTALNAGLASIIEARSEADGKLADVRERLNAVNASLAECGKKPPTAETLRLQAEYQTTVLRLADEQRCIADQRDITIRDIERALARIRAEIARRDALPRSAPFDKVASDVADFAEIYQGPFCETGMNSVHHADDNALYALFRRAVFSTNDLHCSCGFESLYPIEFGYACTANGVFLTVDKIVSHFADNVPLGVITSLSYQYGSTLYEHATAEQFFDAFEVPDVSIDRAHYSQRLLILRRINRSTSSYATIMPVIQTIEVEGKSYDVDPYFVKSQEWKDNVIALPPPNPTPTFDFDLIADVLTIKIPKFAGDWKDWERELKAAIDRGFGPPSLWTSPMQKVVIDLRGNRGGDPMLAFNLYAAITGDTVKQDFITTVVSNALRKHNAYMAANHIGIADRVKMLDYYLTIPQHAYSDGESFNEVFTQLRIRRIMPEALKYEILFDKDTYSSSNILMRLFFRRQRAKTTFDGGLLPCATIDVCTASGSLLYNDAQYMSVSDVRSTRIEFENGDILPSLPLVICNDANPFPPPEIKKPNAIAMVLHPATVRLTEAEFQARLAAGAATGHPSSTLVR